MFCQLRSLNVVVTLCFDIFTPPQRHTYVQRVCVLVPQIKKTDVKLMKNVGHALCQVINRDVFGWFIEIKKMMFPPTKHDFNNSVSLNAFVSNAATSAVIAGHSSNDLEFFSCPYL